VEDERTVVDLADVHAGESQAVQVHVEPKSCSGQADECDAGDSMECECWPGGTYLGCGAFLSLAWAVFGRQECQSDGTWGACSCGEIRPECPSQPTAQCARWCDGISFSLTYDMPPGTNAAAREAAYPYDEVGITVVSGAVNVTGDANHFGGWPVGNHVDTQGGPDGFTNSVVTNPQLPPQRDHEHGGGSPRHVLVAEAMRLRPLHPGASSRRRPPWTAIPSGSILPPTGDHVTAAEVGAGYSSPGHVE
jgi:hypothetical protein